MMKRLGLQILIFFSVFGSQLQGVDTASVVIVVNENDADSIVIGKHYAAARGIPEENIIRLKMSRDETVSLSEFVETVNNPLLDALMEGGWISGVKAAQKDKYGRERLAVAVHRIGFLVTTRGVPLRFANDPKMIREGASSLPKQFQVNQGSVDSELMLLSGPPDVSMEALIPNPFFEGKPVSPTDANRVIKVSRLDGPTRSDVIRLIDRTIEAEKTGLIGRAYMDMGGPHKKGDEWINAAAERVQAAYFDTEMETSKRPRGYEDRLDAPAIYIGWYQNHAYGPWREPRWSVPPGAIGYHLHSYSATTVRSATSAWVGPFVAQGYCATFGYVYEPYLEFTVRPHLFLKYLLAGRNFGDAILLSNPSLSWQTVAIGDPLYRPFGKDLDAQLAESMEGPYAAYLGLRQLNRIEAQVSAEEALNYARTLFVNNPSLAVVYRLAQMYEKRGEQKKAIEVLKVIRFIDSFSRDEAVLVQQMANLLHELGDSRLAFQVYERLLAARNQPRALRIVLLEGGSPVASAAGERVLASRWSLEARTLKTPEQ